MVKTLCLSMALFLCQSLWASQNLAEFHKNFKIIRDEQGQVKRVKLNLGTTRFTIKPYLQQIKGIIAEELANLNNKSAQEQKELFFTELENSSDKSFESEESIGVLRESMNNLSEVKFNNLFSLAMTSGVFKEFENQINDAFALLDPTILAELDDAPFFYKRQVTYEVLKRVLDFAKKKLDSLPVLSLVSYVLVEVHELILEQRTYHQNMLLHYLEKVSEKELGLTLEEADYIYSSIYESRISAVNVFESNQAAEDWAAYGLNKFYAAVRTANNKLRRSRATFDSVGERLNFIFFTAVEGGQRVIKNLLNNKHAFSSQMATAYYLDDPQKVSRFRTYITLGKLGLGFIPLSSWLKSQVENFVDSYYKEQKLTEGALVAHFDLVGNTIMSSKLKSQALNPFIK